MKPNPKYPASTVATPKAVTFGSASIAALLAASAQHASGQIIFSSTGFTVDNATFNWDVDNAGGGDLQLHDNYSLVPISTFSSPKSSMWLSAPANQGRWMANGDNELAALATTAIVSAGADFRSPGAYITSYGNLNYQANGFASGQSSYVGFSFKIGGNTHYGWVQLTPTFGSGNKIEVHQWAYNSVADASITVGQTSAVPEPAAAATGLGLLALGAAGLRRQRWLKRKAA